MIWGVDPASKKIAMFSDDGRVHAHLLLVKPSTRNLELIALRNQMELILKCDPNPVIYCEEPVVAGARNLRSTILIAETAGMILGMRARTVLVPVSSWKKSTVGKGNATKDEVAQWLREEHPGYASHCHGNQDLTDAAALCIYGQQLEIGSTVF